MSILALKPCTGQDFREKPERRSLPDRFKQLHQNAGYVTIKSSINNEIRFIGNSRLPGKFAGDKAAEKKLERQAKSLDYILTQLADESNNNKYQLSKLRKEFGTTGKKDLLDQIATLDQRNREIDAILTGKDSHVFGTSVKPSLGLTHELQELAESDFLALAKASRRSEKKDFSSGNRSTKFTKLARHSCLEAGAVLEILYGKNVMFSTITFPGRTEQAKAAIANYSSIGINRLCQCLRDYSKYHGINIDYVFSWEFHADGALHLHFVWACDDLENHRHRIEQILDRAWFSFLDDLGTNRPVTRGNKAGTYPGCDVYERLPEHIDRGQNPDFKNITSWKDNRPALAKIDKTITHVKCTKSPAAYVSKYVSKEASKLPKGINLYFPSRWWGQSKRLNDTAKEYEVNQDFPKANSDYYECIDYVDQFISHATENGWVNSWHNNTWDIYSQIGSDNDKSKRISRKPWEPRPANSLRVSSGSQICIYIKPEYFLEAREYIAAIATVPRGLKAMPPKDFNEFHNNKYYSSNEENAIDNDAKIITARRHSKHRNYWEKIAAGENYQDIYL